MPRVPGRTRRLLLSLAVGIGLVAGPGVASADPPTTFTEHFVFFRCFFSDSELGITANVSSEFGAGAFVESPDIFGETVEGVTVVESGGGATIDAVIPLLDSEGNPTGAEATLHAVLSPTGEVRVEESRDHVGNIVSRFTGTFRSMAVSGSLTLPDMTFDLSTGDCVSEIGDVEVRDTQPHAFTLNNSGVVLDCFWETPDAIARLFVINDTFGVFVEAFLEVPGEHLLLPTGEGTATLTTESLEVSGPLFDEVTGMTEFGTASATLAPLGAPVTSTFVFQSGRQRVTEQRLIPTGTLTFSTGHSFTLDAESCFVSAFDSHVIDAAPAGPKPGATTAVNDTAEGATALTVGGVVNDHTRNTAVAPELQIEACPEPDDRFGHTLWYSFTGTGGPVTIDTAGSNFDTVIAVYDESLTLLACNDDVEFEPIGGTLQAALTIETELGATYLIQAGGFDGVAFTGVSEPEFGRLRLRIS